MHVFDHVGREMLIHSVELERAVLASMQGLLRLPSSPWTASWRAGGTKSWIYLQQNHYDLASRHANNAALIQNKKLEGEACANLSHCLLQFTDSSKNQSSE
eukprot:768054-Hanusia_phi.AAC.1